METHNLSGKEIELSFRAYLIGLEGDCSAKAIADAWNKIAKSCEWHDRLKATIKT